VDPESLAALHEALLCWFGAHRRPLAFRADRRAYPVLVAEFMLQQTRAEVVGPYLERFLRRFPDVPTLAAADEQEVLALWRGLGYYQRARNLHRAARQMRLQHDGGVPAQPAALRALPGVGPYIAGAVGAFAFGRDEAALDANARRVLSRLFDREAGAALAQAAVPPGRAAAWNEALMDLGSAVCLPRRPRCGLCPLRALCRGRASGRAEALPARPARPPRPELEVTTLLLRDAQGRFALLQRPARGLLAGMWELPSLPAAVEAPAVAVALGLRLIGAATALPGFRHVFTHRVWNVRPFAALGSGPARWVSAAELGGVPLAGPSARLVAGAAPDPAN